VSRRERGKELEIEIVFAGHGADTNSDSLRVFGNLSRRGHSRVGCQHRFGPRRVPLARNRFRGWQPWICSPGYYAPELPPVVVYARPLPPPPNPLTALGLGIGTLVGGALAIPGLVPGGLFGAIAPPPIALCRAPDDGSHDGPPFLERHNSAIKVINVARRRCLIVSLLPSIFPFSRIGLPRRNNTHPKSRRAKRFRRGIFALRLHHSIRSGLPLSSSGSLRGLMWRAMDGYPP
jgi:hypothetical protein